VLHADPLPAALGDHAVGDGEIEGATADPLAGLQDDDGAAALDQLVRGGQAGQSGTGDDHVDRL
jgi:hypothetical protein